MILKFIATINYFRNRLFIVNINKTSYKNNLDYKFILFYLRRID